MRRPEGCGRQRAPRGRDATGARLHRPVGLALGARRRGAAALALLLTVWAPVAVAQVTEASSTTVLRLEPDWRTTDGRVGLWGTEYIGLSVRGLDIPGAIEDLRFQLSAWGTAATITGTPEQLLTGDFDLLYMQGSLFHRHLTVTVGRQLISGGAARVLQLDGLNANVAIGKYFGISGFVGQPVQAPTVSGVGVNAYVAAPTVSRGVVPLGDFAFGGRAYWRPSYGTEVGVSFLDIQNGSQVARQDLGVDAHVLILPNLSLTASSILSLVELRVADGQLGLSWHILPTLELFVNGMRTEPDLFLSRTSIFSVFAYTQRTAAGGGVFWQALPRLSFYGEYNQLWVDGGSGNEALLGITYKLDRKSSVGLNGHLLYVPVNGYTELRAWVLESLTDRIRLSADLQWQLLENLFTYAGTSIPYNATRDSIVGTASVSWLIGCGWSGMLSGSIGTTPLNLTRYTVTARVGYNFTTFDAGTPR